MRSIRSSRVGTGKRSLRRSLGWVGRRFRTAGDSPAWSRGFLSRLLTAPRPGVCRLAGPHLGLEMLETRQLLAANPIITEFMADNGDNVGLGEVERDYGKPDPFGNGSTPDWLEVFNAGDEALDLAGYHLTDDATDLSRWTFPSTVVQPGGYLVVYATGMSGAQPGDYVDGQGNVFLNFGMDVDGEYLALVAPDGQTVLSEVNVGGRGYPLQQSDVSYGYVQTSPLLSERSDAHFWVPVNGNLGMSWTEVGFDAAAHGFTAGKASLGYEDKPTDRTNFVGAFETQLPSGVHGAFVRTAFDVQSADAVSSLLLRMKYDNAFIAYINGVEVARDGAPDVADWFSTAPSGSRRDSLALEFTDFDLSPHAGLLREGPNALAIHLLNNLSDNSDLLLAFELYSDKPLAESNLGYLLTPTPGSANIVFGALTGPLVKDLTENPGELADDQDLVVTAVVAPHNAPVDSATLHYRVNFGEELTVAMVDDGTGGDQAAGDGIYSATIPASASEPGDMVRWRMTTLDVEGNSMRWPLFADPIDSDQYHGTIVADPSLQSNLPVLHWFIESPRGADGATGARGSFFYLGEFYDNVDANIHGQSSQGFPKKSYDLDFNEGNRFRWKEGEGRVRDVNLLSIWADKGKFRNTLAYDMYRESGSPYLFAFPVRSRAERRVL